MVHLAHKNMLSFNLNKAHSVIAVYLLYVNQRLAYIGRAGNLRNRLNRHLNPNDPHYIEWKEDISRIEYYECQSIVDSDILETYLINILKPFYNVDKVFPDLVSFKLELPEKFELIAQESPLDKINKVLGKENYVSKLNLTEAIRLVDEGKCKPDDIELKYPLLAEGYKKLGAKKLKRLAYVPSKIRRELKFLEENTQYAIKKELNKQLKLGEVYLTSYIKSILVKVYKDLGLTKKSKIADIDYYFETEKRRKRSNGSLTRIIILKKSL